MLRQIEEGIKLPKTSAPKFDWPADVKILVEDLMTPLSPNVENVKIQEYSEIIRDGSRNSKHTLLGT